MQAASLMVCHGLLSIFSYETSPPNGRPTLYYTSKSDKPQMYALEVRVDESVQTLYGIFTHGDFHSRNGQIKRGEKDERWYCDANECPG